MSKVWFYFDYNWRNWIWYIRLDWCLSKEKISARNADINGGQAQNRWGLPYVIFFNDTVAWLLRPVNISNRNEYSTLLSKTCHQIRLLYFSILLSKFISLAMHYDDYFDSFSITSTSKAPEYPLWIPRCFFHCQYWISSLFHCLSIITYESYSTIPDNNSLLYL